ncbi:MAG: hypothetical protein HRU51_05515 [Xanthomonadales bacterium]|nr:hypothetical protein [Xanthomonadales bacterium]
MMNAPIPQTYEQWRHCITVHCGIPLTQDYVRERLSIWRNQKLEETARFRRLYGDQHWRAVTTWFEQAERELLQSPTAS